MSQALSEKDKQQISSIGITEDKIARELKLFQEGISFIHLEAPCTIEHGIKKIDNEISRFILLFEEAMKSGRAMKFTPASGAASRMFRLLLSFCNNSNQLDRNEILQGAAKENPDLEKVHLFFDSIEKFPFYEDLKKSLSDKGYEIKELISGGEYKTILEYLLTEKGLNYANTPKGLIPFHRYNNYSRTPFEEHLAEAEHYTADRDGICKIHFTVNEEYAESINKKLDISIKKTGNKEKQFHITCSSQLPSTDTIAVDMDNRPFRDERGSLLFRPAGHGALLENLNAVKGDIVFIKNIDNVAPDRLKETTIIYKKALGGYLIEIQDQIFKILNKIEAKEFDSYFITQTFKYMKEDLSLIFPQEIEKTGVEEQAAYIFSRLNRPVRVCGMVKNEGEPGGGPFWVKDKKGLISLQIVEKAQINLQDEKQRQHFEAATHFNPVDLVCGVCNYKGKPFDLRDYSDPDTGFISIKSYDGKKLKALELPGLWNGAMTKWITLFVEVPIATFTPVKTVFDLLRKEHQPG